MRPSRERHLNGVRQSAAADCDQIPVLPNERGADHPCAQRREHGGSAPVSAVGADGRDGSQEQPTHRAGGSSAEDGERLPIGGPPFPLESIGLRQTSIRLDPPAERLRQLQQLPRQRVGQVHRGRVHPCGPDPGGTAQEVDTHQGDPPRGEKAQPPPAAIHVPGIEAGIVQDFALRL